MIKSKRQNNGTIDLLRTNREKKNEYIQSDFLNVSVLRKLNERTSMEIVALEFSVYITVL